MKTKEELKALKEAYEEMQKKLQDLTEEELEAVTAGRIAVDDKRRKKIRIQEIK